MTQRPDTSGPRHLATALVIAAAFVALLIGVPSFVADVLTERARLDAASAGEGGDV